MVLNCFVQSADIFVINSRFADRFADDLYGFVMLFNGVLRCSVVLYNLLTDSLKELLTDLQMYMDLQCCSMVFYEF